MPDALSVAIIITLCLVLALLSYILGMLTASGSISAFVVGLIIGIFGSITWLIVLIVFAVLGFVVTRYKIQLKIKKGFQEGRKGERNYRNVLANGLIPALIALFSWMAGIEQEAIPAILFLTAVSVAASDTVASELGILSSNTRLITTFERVAPGTNGGVSPYGTTWALLGAIGASIFGWLVLFPDQLIDARILIPMVVGFVGCNVDSLIGATLEQRGYVGKLGTNMISMATGSLIALLILLVI